MFPLTRKVRKIDLIEESPGNFVDGPGKTICVIQVARLLFVLSKKYKIHIQCMLQQNVDGKESV